MEKIKIKKKYHDFHVEIEKAVAERLFQHCQETENKIISVFRRSLKQNLDAEKQKNFRKNNYICGQKMNV